MPASSSPEDWPRTQSVLKQRRSAEVRFLADLEAGKNPRIEDFLDQVSESERSELLCDLLRAELRARCSGPAADKHGYRTRFAQYRHEVDRVFAELSESPISTDEQSGVEAQIDTTITFARDGRADITPAGQPGHISSPPESPQNHELIRRLGQGGMGVVYLARQLNADRLVAVKFIEPGRLSRLCQREYREAVRRFQVEARAMARLHHDHIVTVYDVGETSDGHYYTMQYVDGASVADIRRAGPLPNESIARHVASIADAVHTAHQHGILHRDLKPSNVLINSQTDRALVADFGLAKILEGDQDATFTGEVLGTPAFMSPEQARDSASATTSSDVYGVGTILYFLLTGRPPFRGGSIPDILRQVAEDDPPIPSTWVAQTDRDLETICMKCLAKEPKRRYASCQDVSEELKRWIRGEPIKSRPIRRVERGWRWCRRNPLLAVFVSITLLLVLVMLIASPIIVLREQSLRAGAESEAIRARDAEIAAVTSEKRATVAAAEVRRTLAEKAFQAARLASERGQWRQSLENLRESEEMGYPDQVALRLETIQALDALTLSKDCSQEIQLLSQLPEISKHRGKVLLWQGAIALRRPTSGNSANAVQNIRDAIDAGLCDPDMAYAHALLAETVPEAVAHLRDALDKAPFHHQARGYLVVLLTFMGRRDEARHHAATGRLLYPEDPNFPLMLGFIAALEKDLATAYQRIDETRGQYSEWQIDMLKQMCEDVRELTALSGNWGTDDHRKNYFALGRLVFDLNRLQGTRHPGDGKSPDAAPVRLDLPPLIREAYGGLVLRLVSSTLLFRNEALLEVFHEAARINPDATSYFMQGILHFTAHRWAEAESAFLRAEGLPALLPDVKRELLFFAAMAAAGQWGYGGRNPADLQRAVQHARGRVNQGPLPPNEASLLLHVAFAAKDVPLAQAILPQLPPTQPTSRYRKISEHALLADAAEILLKQNPQSEQGLMDQAEAVKAIRELLGDGAAGTRKGGN
jgi:tRNA A-37 threonylcarbamoyl transferase component Bud32/tetratricopeptide (TPR) repeat protein